VDATNTAGMLKSRGTPGTDRNVSLTRIASLKLSRAICRSFLKERDVRPALSACAEAIAEALSASQVTISIGGADGEPAEAAGIPPAASAGHDRCMSQFEFAVPIHGEEGQVGTLAVARALPQPPGLEPFLEEVALEIGRCLSDARLRADASERLRQESALKPSTLIGIACLDSELRITGWNAGCREILGWPADDVLGRELSPVLGSTASCQLVGSLQMAMDGRPAKPCFVTVRRWDGRESPTSIEVLPVLNGTDDRVEMRLIIRDESRLARLQQLVGVFSTVSRRFEGFASLDEVAEPVLREICSGWGLLRGELWQLGQPDADWVLVGEWGAGPSSPVPSDVESGHGLDRELPQSVRKHRDVVRFENLAAASGNPRIVAAAEFGLHDAIGIPVFVDGDVAGAMLFFGFDVPQLDAAWTAAFQAIASHVAALIRKERSERDLREAQQNLVQSQKMEAVGLLAGGVAHDFNNLLTIILGSSEIALEMLDDGSPAAGLLREVENAGRRAADLTRQLLAFSRKQPLETVVLDVNSRLTDAETMLRRLVDDRIELQFQPGQPIHHIRFDPVQFDQVLLNLVANARDAIDGAGRIVVSTRNAALSAAAARKYIAGRPGEFVVVSVSDTGCGIDEATLARVFDPFFTTKERGKGTGMGLATVYGIVNQSGGFLAVDSRPGTGTTFSAFLPGTHDVPLTMQVDANLAAGAIGSERILLVEDEDVLRSLTAQMLKVRGYTVLPAAGGVEALRLLRRKRGHVDLLVTDVMMPEMTGPALASQVRAAGYRIPVLFVSGYVDDCPRDGGPAVARSPLLRKPFTSVELAAAVRRVLDGDKLPGVVH